MRKQLILAVMVLFGYSVNFVQAQTTKRANEVKIGMGFLTDDDLANLAGSGFVYFFSGGTITYTEPTSFVAGSFSYKREVARNLMLGTVFSYQAANGGVERGNTRIGESRKRRYTVAIESDYRYISKNIFKMYSGIGIGYTFGKQDVTFNDTGIDNRSEDFSLFAFQITGIGVRVGKAFSGFAELGYGYRGMLSLGVSYQF